MKLIGANSTPRLTGRDALPSKSHYFIGRDRSLWRTNVPHYAKVEYAEIYSGVNLVFYGNQRQLEFDFVIMPGSDPGKIHLEFEGAQNLHLDAEGNLGAYIDRWLLQGHLWRPLWDPEGLLSTFPAIATTLLGVLVGEWLQSEPAPRPARPATPAGGQAGGQKLVGLFALGAAGLAAGKLLDPWFPINKNLWTSSYVLFTAGFAAVLLGVCYGLIELRGYRRWATPFVVLGMNSIAVFFLSTLVAKIGIVWKVTRATGETVSVQRWVYEGVFAPLASPVNASLLFALTYLGVWLAAMWVLYRRRIFIKI